MSVLKWMYNTTTTCSTSAASYPNTTTTWTESAATNNAKYICIYVQDTAGNYSTAVSTNDINVDVTGPLVWNVTATNVNGAYNAGATIDITMQFSEVVYVTGTPKLALNTNVLRT